MSIAQPQPITVIRGENCRDDDSSYKHYGDAFTVHSVDCSKASHIVCGAHSLHMSEMYPLWPQTTPEQRAVVLLSMGLMGTTFFEVSKVAPSQCCNNPMFTLSAPFLV